MSDLKSKIQAKMAEPTLAALATKTEDGKPWVRYVMALADQELGIRIATFLNSRKVAQIKADPEVHLTLGVASLETARSYLQVQGRAEILTEAAERQGMWGEELAQYFSGPDDPNYCVIKVAPYRIEYNDMASGSMEPQVWEK
jgi:general stress protein 26